MLLNRAHQKRRLPFKDALFLLVPNNPKAESVVDAEDNEHLVSFSADGVKAFDIGFHINSQYSSNTLVTLGRDNCDIFLKPTSISKIQCSFEIDDLDTGIVMLYDRSHSLSTQVSGTTSMNNRPFEAGRFPRKVLVHPGCNDKISMGGKNGDLIMFTIEWLLKEDEINRVSREHRDVRKGSITNPRKARTRDPTDTILPSMKMTPDQAFIQPNQLALRYLKRNIVDSGSYGIVWRVIGVDSGRVMAMKKFGSVPGSHEQEYVAKIRSEVELMRIAKHPNIADLITSQGWGDGCSSIQIFMGLEEGDVRVLSKQNKFTLRSGLPERCLKQMLSALNFLACQDIVHRDVKPDNILFSRSIEGPGYDFRLADFGVGKLVKFAYSCQGTHWYMAPEILRLRSRLDADGQVKQRQSPKVDVWSLFVAIAHARKVCDFDGDFYTDDQILNVVREACKEHWMSKYRAMAIEDPGDRASAHDMLSNHFNEVIDWASDNVKTLEDDDEAPMDLQVARLAQHAPLRLKPRRSPRNGHPFKIEKTIPPHYSRARKGQTV